MAAYDGLWQARRMALDRAGTAKMLKRRTALGFAQRRFVRMS
jgi:hypothetical protein